MRIACPKCDFSPSPKLRWQCNPAGCGHLWHTFATHGVCPRCFKVWHDTQCPRCKLWSPIDDWYHEAESLRPMVLKQVQKEPEKELRLRTFDSCDRPSVLEKAFKER